jgi:hypothetical protein
LALQHEDLLPLRSDYLFEARYEFGGRLDELDCSEDTLTDFLESCP